VTAAQASPPTNHAPASGESFLPAISRAGMDVYADHPVSFRLPSAFQL